VSILKIFQVVPYYPPHVGGMEYYVQHLSEELASRGHEVTVFTTSNEPTPSIVTTNGVKIYSLKKMVNIYNIPIVPTLFWELVSKEKPDVVHTHQYPVFFSDVAAAASWLKHTPLLLQVHIVSDAKSPLSGFISDMYYTTLGLKTLRTADTVIVPSLAYRTKLIGMHVNPKQLQVIPYGIDTKRFSGALKSEEFRVKYNCQGSKVILSVGRLNYQKGFQYLIAAMPAIIKQIPNAKLMIVGIGEELTYLKNLTKSLNLNKSVIFTGRISQTEIPTAYAASDLFVLPSLFEAFGISLIEAQAAGKPVICTRTGGTPEAIIDGETGFLIEPKNPKQLEKTIVRVLSDDALSRRMGAKGRAFVEERFDNKKVIYKIINAYEKLSNR
jgi:glycosyltransferase involved in cell wall biosynthesis